MLMYQQNKKYTKKNNKRILGIVIVAVILLGAATWALIDSRRPNEPQPTANSLTKGESSSDLDLDTAGSQPSPPSTSPQPTATPQPGNDKVADGTTGANLLDPSGTFVSNHSPNLSGSPAPNTIQSTCNTTPGATCTISFTKDGITRQLQAQKTDAGGATYWNWKLQDVGLTEGSWQVSATARLGAQTKTTNDALPLEVAK